jgi:hypothetical protein
MKWLYCNVESPSDLVLSGILARDVRIPTYKIPFSLQIVLSSVLEPTSWWQRWDPPECSAREASIPSRACTVADSESEKEEPVGVEEGATQTDKSKDRMSFQVVPVSKKASDTTANYLAYFARVAAANAWDDTTAARIFPGLLEVGSTVLDDLEEATLKSFKLMQLKLEPPEESYRESKVQEYFNLAIKNNEKVTDFAQRCRIAINGIYPKFAAANKEMLIRDRFVHGLSAELKSVVLNGRNTKFEDAVETALMAENVNVTAHLRSFAEGAVSLL